jgi:hypothetical protein
MDSRVALATVIVRFNVPFTQQFEGNIMDRSNALTMTMQSATQFLILVALCSAMSVVPSTAQNCWADVSTHSGCRPGDAHRLQFRNNCAGGQRTVNVCVLWTTGSSSGQTNRHGAYATGGQVALITPGLCQNGDFRYTWRADGSPPACPVAEVCKTFGEACGGNAGCCTGLACQPNYEAGRQMQCLPAGDDGCVGPQCR